MVNLLRAPRVWLARDAATVALAILLAATLLAAAPDRALGQSWPQPELRLDVLGPSPYSLQPGAGANLALGTYTRAGVNAGLSTRPDSAALADRWRVDLIARFLLDPFRQQRWGVAVGGGLSIRRRAFLVVILELEGPEYEGWLPALQIGASGGVRAGIVARRAVRQRR